MAKPLNETTNLLRFAPDLVFMRIKKISFRKLLLKTVRYSIKFPIMTDIRIYHGGTNKQTPLEIVTSAMRLSLGFEVNISVV